MVSGPSRGPGRRPRLEHVDAMRPIKQVGMLTTHALLFFAPAASVATGGLLVLTHVTRFMFMFVSAAMLVYAYPHVQRIGRRTFWRRRLAAVAGPYLVWTVVYFLLDSVPSLDLPPQLKPGPGLVADPVTSVAHLLQLAGTGYFQLYYLLVLMQFYVLYPGFLWLIERTRGHHSLLLALSFAGQLLLTAMIHWQVLPAWLRGGAANKEVWNYQLYLIAGGLMAWHYDQVHAWLRRHWRTVAATAVATAILAEAWYSLAWTTWPALRGGGVDEPFQPIVVPLYLALTAAVYLIAVAVTENPRSTRARARLLSAADNSYGIYLCHALLLAALAVLDYKMLDDYLPWPVVLVGAIVIVYFASSALTSRLRRLPGAFAWAGSARISRTDGTERAARLPSTR